MFQRVDGAAICDGREVPVPGGQLGLGDALNKFFRGQPERDEIGDRDDGEIVFARDLLELGHSGHRAVFIHDLADDGGRPLSCQQGKVHGSLGLAGSDQDATVVVGQREYVAGPGELRRMRMFICQQLDRACAVCC